jgi:ribosomal protein L32E
LLGQVLWKLESLLMYLSVIRQHSERYRSWWFSLLFTYWRPYAGKDQKVRRKCWNDWP